jgi:hypothetical protein
LPVTASWANERRPDPRSGLLHFGRGLALPMGSSGVDGLGVQTNGEETEQQAGEDTGNQIENEFHGGIQVLVSDLLFNFDFNAAF